jgi:hypothetical protein
MSDLGKVNTANNKKYGPEIQSSELVKDREKWSRAVARQSRIAAVLSFVGGIVILSSFWWSYQHLRSTTLELQKINEEITDKQIELHAKEVEAARLDQEIIALRNQKQAYAVLLGGVSPDALEKALHKHPQAAELVPRVYIRIAAQAQSDLAQRVAKGLRSKGLLVPGIEPEPDDKSSNETQLRYFSHEDENDSDIRSIQMSLAQMGIQAIVTYASPHSGQTESRRKYFELWFATDLKTPVTLMSNTELKNVVVQFVGGLRRKNGVLYDNLDDITRLQLVLDNPITRQSADATDNVKRQIAAKRQASIDEMNSLVQSDVPLANLYLKELLRRLGPQKEAITTFSAVPSILSINAFAGRSMYLYDLAQELQP